LGCERLTGRLPSKGNSWQ